MAKKDSARAPRLDEGKKLLEQWGITLAQLQAQHLTAASLTERLGHDPAADLALASLLGDYAAPEAAQTLVEWEAKTQEKTLRREIHRSLYKLAQKGVHAERPPREPQRSVLTPIEPEGYLSVMDGRGDRLIWLVKTRAGGGLHYLSALVNEPEGMRFVEGAEVTRKMLRTMRQEMADRMQMILVDAPWRYCDAIMHEGYERARARNGKEVESYPALRSHIAATPAQQPTEIPLGAGLDPDAILADEQLLPTSLQLFEEEEFQRWLLDPERMKPYLEQISQAQESPLVLNRYQQQDRMQLIMEKAVSEIFSPEGGKVYARRLQEATLYLAATGRGEAARRALAVALALPQSEHGGKGIPFCEELVRQSISLHYQVEQKHEQEEKPGSLIMRPSEFAARMQAAQRRRMR